LRRIPLGGERVLFGALLAIHLIPIWSFAHFPTQDGPTHLENAQILREYHFADRTAFREYYTLNTQLNPNWSTHLLLAGLLWVFPPLISEKILLSGYVLLLPLSARYALRALSPGSEFLALLAFPFIYNLLLTMGFYNFVYSLPVFFFFVGLWLKNRGGLSARAIAKLASLALLLFFCHLVSLVMAMCLIAVAVLWLTVADAWTRIRSNSGGLRSALAAAGSGHLPALIAFIPALILAAVFLSRRGIGGFPSPPFHELLKRLINLDSLASHNARELILSTALAGLFGAMTIYMIAMKARERRLEPLDVLLLVAGLYLVVYFSAPSGLSGGGFLTHRLNLFPYFALLLWLGAQKWSQIPRGIIRLAAVMLAAGIVVLQSLSYAAINEQLDEYLSGMNMIEKNSTLLPLCYSPFGRGSDEGRLSARVGMFLHAAGYIAAERRAVELDNYEANSDYFPTMYRPERNPEVHLALREGGLEKQPPCVDLLSYAARTGGTVDYVLVWDLRRELMTHRCVRVVLEQLSAGYDLVHTSPAGLMQLYRRKDYERSGASDSR